VTRLSRCDLKNCKCHINHLIHRRIWCFRCQILRTTKIERGFWRAMIKSSEVLPSLNMEHSLLSLTCLALVRFTIFLFNFIFYFIIKFLTFSIFDFVVLLVMFNKAALSSYNFPSSNFIALLQVDLYKAFSFFFLPTFHDHIFSFGV
jgi:hypothetical protein